MKLIFKSVQRNYDSNLKIIIQNFLEFFNISRSKIHKNSKIRLLNLIFIQRIQFSGPFIIFMKISELFY